MDGLLQRLNGANTHEEIKSIIDAQHEAAMRMSTHTPMQAKRQEHMLEHIARIRLIYKPFPVVLRRQSAMIHSGTIVGDKFFGDGQGGSSRSAKSSLRRSGDSEDWSNRAYIRDAETALT